MNIFAKIRSGFEPVLRNPRFAATVIVVLALGIGISVATLGLLYRYYVSPLPYPQGDRIVKVYFTANQPIPHAMSIPTWQRLRKNALALADSGLYRPQGYNLTRGSQMRRLNGIEATASVFSTLGVHPILGRVFDPKSNRPGAKPVVVLSYRLWQTLFSGSPSAIGQTLRLNGKFFTVIGVMPKSFNFPTAQSALWTPRIITAVEQSVGRLAALNDQMIGRLAPGKNIAALTTQANVVLKNEITNFPVPKYIPMFQKYDLHIAAQSWRASRLGHLHQSLVLVQFATALLMLLVWFNLANLFLARSFARRSELTLRRILGANMGTLVGSLLRENMFLSLIGAGLGVALGRFLLGLFSGSSSVAASVSSIPGTSWSVLVLIAVVLAMISAGIFTLVGLGFLRGHNLAAALSESGSRASPGPLARRIRKGLLVAQIALAGALAGCGLLLGHSLLNLNAVNLGFKPKHVVTFKLTFPKAQYSPDAIRINLDALYAAVAKLPGLAAVSIASDVPLDNNFTQLAVFPRPPNPAIKAIISPHSTDTDYLKTLNIPLLAGRNFKPSDAKSALGVTIIDTLTAKQLFGTGDAVGRRFSFSPYSNGPGVLFRVIGVVPTAHEQQVSGTAQYGTAYMDRDQVLRLNPGLWHGRTWYLAVRSPLPTAAVISEVKNTVHKLLLNIPLYDIRTMNQRVGEALSLNRILTILVAVFAFGALLLAAIGLYAVQAYAVTQRAREFAIRAALGANRSRLLTLVLGEAALLLVLGLVIGLAGLVGIGIAFASAFYGIAAVDPLSMALVAIVLTLATLAASWFPAWRASRVAPDKALRS